MAALKLCSFALRLVVCSPCPARAQTLTLEEAQRRAVDRPGSSPRRTRPYAHRAELAVAQGNCPIRC